jgi:hypothetical protein
VKPSLSRRITAEFAGTLFLLAAVVGSGIMAERLSTGNTALALLANSIATGCALVAIILTFLRPHLRSTSKSRGHPRRSMAAQYPMARDARLSRRPNNRSLCRRGHGAPHVRPLPLFSIHPHPNRFRATPQ